MSEGVCQSSSVFFGCSSVFVGVRRWSLEFGDVRRRSLVFLGIRRCLLVFLGVRGCSSVFVSVHLCLSVSVGVRRVFRCSPVFVGPFGPVV